MVLMVKKIITIALASILSVLILAACRNSDPEQAALPTAPHQELAVSKAVRIRTRSEGVIRIDLADLGWDNIDLNQLRLIHRDQVLPLWTEQDNQENDVYFYAWESDSRYTADNFFLLQSFGDPSPHIINRVWLPPDGQATGSIFSLAFPFNNNVASSAMGVFL